MQELKPVAMLTADELECLGKGGTAIVIPVGDALPDDDCTALYALPDTHRIVSVELLEQIAFDTRKRDTFEAVRAIIDNTPK